MLKISQAGKANQSVTLKLEGRVVGPWVGELRQVCETHLSEGRVLKLDLADVTFADADGVLVGIEGDGEVVAGQVVGQGERSCVSAPSRRAGLRQRPEGDDQQD